MTELLETLKNVDPENHENLRALALLIMQHLRDSSLGPRALITNAVHVVEEDTVFGFGSKNLILSVKKVSPLLNGGVRLEGLDQKGEEAHLALSPFSTVGLLRWPTT